MRRFALAAVALGALALAATGVADAKDKSVATGSTTFTNGTRDWVHGTIKRTHLDGSGDLHFTVSATRTPNGVAGAYHATYDYGPSRKESYTGTVTCLKVAGAHATVGIRITQSSRPGIEVGEYQFLRVSDYGAPGAGGQRDSISPGPTSATPACPAPAAVRTPTYWAHLIVHDAP